ncbi:STAS domain-containing protein [Actinacidiphila sp. bgisy160]|uniref:STAS domain-containing protein n=1 Tax=Actinacidiphila sp. bgisy160 TaxID=3413796 RepID=UPI003D73A2CD
MSTTHCPSPTQSPKAVRHTAGLGPDTRLQEVGIAVRRDDDGRALVMVCGELDVAAAPRVHAVLQDCADRGEHITVDLRDLVFIDCSGLRPLVAAAALSAHRGRRFTIGAASAPVRRVLGLTRLTRLLDEDPAP